MHGQEWAGEVPPLALRYVMSRQRYVGRIALPQRPRPERCPVCGVKEISLSGSPLARAWLAYKIQAALAPKADALENTARRKAHKLYSRP